MSLSSLPWKESESSFGHKIIVDAAGSEEVAGSDDNSTALAVGKRGDKEQIMMMQPPIEQSDEPLCLCHLYRGRNHEDQTHNPICPQYEGAAGSVTYIYGNSDSDSVSDGNSNSDSDSDSSFVQYEYPPVDSDTDSESDYDSYYDDLPIGKSRDRINKIFMPSMELAAAQACVDMGGGLKLEDFQMVKSYQQTTGIAMTQYIIFRAKDSLDGKTFCFVAKVSFSYDDDDDEPSEPVMIETVEFVRQIDDLSQVTETEWPKTGGIRPKKKVERKEVSMV